MKFVTLRESMEKTYSVDGYSFDDYDCSMSIFIADYGGDEEDEHDTLTRTEANTLFERLVDFSGWLNKR